MTRCRRGEKTYGAHDSCLPLEHVVTGGTGTARGGGIPAEVDEFLLRNE